MSRHPRVERSGALAMPIPPAALPTVAFRFKRLPHASLLQQAWRHPDGLEWRNVTAVPEQTPDWEPASDAAAPLAR